MNANRVDYQLIRRVLSAISPISSQTAIALEPATRIQNFEKGEILETAGRHVRYQFVVISGVIRKFLTNAKGDEFTIDFFCAGQVITPTLLRSVDFVSFVNLEVISLQAAVMTFSQELMEATMQGNKDLEALGFKAIMHDAYKRAEREKILLTATGAEKLDWFRKYYPNLENEVPHYYIASFLGLTPTSLSRLRTKKG
ncbi:MAG: Crp/Fnr family transcriptional regulator [Saprospiraceae bacterium]